MLYYSNGGPGPASKLLRVKAPPNATLAEWQAAPGEAWGEAGWQPWPGAQVEIQQLGEFFMIDESQVAKAQNEIRAANARARRESQR